MLVVLSGGGTAGHINPALAVAEVLQERGCDVRFAGCPTGVEARLAPQAGLPFVPFEAAGFNRRHPLSLAGALAKIQKSTQAAKRWFAEERPDVVVGFGGYVSIPVARAAEACGVPVVVHEQNSVMGMANKYLARLGARGVRDLRAVRRRRGRSGPRARHGQPGARLGARRHPRRGADASGRARRRAHAARVRRKPGRAADQRGRGRLQGRPAGRAWPARRAHHRAARAGKRAAGARAHAGRAKTVARHGLPGPHGGDAGGGRRRGVALGRHLARGDLGAGDPRAARAVPHATEDHQTKNAQAYVDAGCAYLLPDDRVATPEFRRLVLSLVQEPDVRARMAQAARGQRPPTRRAYWQML